MKLQSTGLRMLACFAVLSMGAIANADDWTEVGDAGNLFSAGPQLTVGTGSLDTISGFTDTAGGDIQDVYVITVTDASSFYATTEETFGRGTGTADFDTRLYLFELDFTGMMANDDFAGAPFHSIISTPSLFPNGVDAGVIDVVDGGTYLLAISGFSENAMDTAGAVLFDVDGDFSGLKEGLGTGVLGGWENGASASGNYVIELSGASFGKAVPEPTSLGLLAFGMAAVVLRRRRS